MLKFKNVSKSFKNLNGIEIYALQNISFNIYKGEICGIIGESGAGKSTIINLINQNLYPSNGTIYLENIKYPNKNILNKISMIYQDFRLLKSRNVFKNIALPLEIKKVNYELIEKKVNNLLKLVELENFSKQPISKLSGGQKQRVAIARALITEPELLLCDEITSALDPLTTNKIINILKKINTKTNQTILFISHDMESIINLCSKTIVLQKGKLSDEININNYIKKNISLKTIFKEDKEYVNN